MGTFPGQGYRLLSPIDQVDRMCDFPNVENNDFELEALSEFCEGWRRRIDFLDELFGQGHADESLILCCCYIESIGAWFHESGTKGEETFAKALLKYDENEVFSKINPWRLFDVLRKRDGIETWSIVPGKPDPAIKRFQDGFYSFSEVRDACRAALPSEEFALLDGSLWMGTLAAQTYRVTKCGEVHNGSFTIPGCSGTVIDFRLLYPVLIRIFENARRLIMSGKLKVY